MNEIRTSSSTDELRFRLQGGVHEPGDESYPDTRTLVAHAPNGSHADRYARTVSDFARMAASAAAMR